MSVASALGLALADALPGCAQVLVDGARTRANIAAAVRAVEVSHDLRMAAVDEIEWMLRRYGPIMSQELRNEYLLGILRLLDSGHYVMPWDRLLRR